MRKTFAVVCTAALALAGLASRGQGACCYFAAKDKDILQPAQKAFIAWDEQEKMESFTVQPKFEGNAPDFGMVIPTPGRPKLDEMPRDFFKELAVFTILKPMDMSKYKRIMYFSKGGAGAMVLEDLAAGHSVRVLESGVVGSLDYKIIQADKADDLYDWLTANNYNYGGDQAALDYYIKKGWFFTTMKIDPKQMKTRPDGSYDGEVTPTRFAFSSEKLVYPLKITQLSVKDRTEALFYVQAAHKMDLAGDFSYQPSFCAMWLQASSYAIPEKLTEQEKAWQKALEPQAAWFHAQIAAISQKGHQPSTLEWAHKLTNEDLAVLSGDMPYDREAPKEDVDKLKLLKGHLQEGRFITKFRKVFAKDEMGDDLEFSRAQVHGQDDDLDFVSILPTSPP